MTIVVCMIGLCAAALLIYYVYVLMKGDCRNVETESGKCPCYERQSD